MKDISLTLSFDDPIQAQHMLAFYELMHVSNGLVGPDTVTVLVFHAPHLADVILDGFLMMKDEWSEWGIDFPAREKAFIEFVNGWEWTPSPPAPQANDDA